MMARHVISGVAIALGLAACSAYGPDPTYRDVVNPQTRHGVTFLYSGDQGSGPMLTVMGQFDAAGRFHKISEGAGPGTFQTFTEGGLSGIALGAGTAGFGLATGASKTIISNVGNSRATGGRATGGNASLNANLSNRQAQRQTQHQSATATSDAAAHSASSSTSTGGNNPLFPNGTTLHTPNGDIVVDPTVTVTQ